MSYTLTPIAVDLEAVRNAVGSKDQALLRRLTKKYADELEEIGALAEEYEEDEDEIGSEFAGKPQEALASMQEDLARLLRGETLDKGSLLGAFLDDSPPKKASKSRKKKQPPRASASGVFRHLIMGENPDRRVGFMYGYALQLLCSHFGKELPHDRWFSLRRGSQWFRELDEALQSVGVPAETLSVSKQLVERGAPVPIPTYSDFPSIGYLEGGEVSRALDAVEMANLDAVPSEETRAYLCDARDWLQACAESKKDMICFYC